MKVPFGMMNATVAGTILANTPKHRRLVEPFGDGGTLALAKGFVKPREHVLNVADETLFAAFSFAQSFSGSDLRALKKFDWVASPETFEAASAITATEGPEFFYRFLYLKKFGMQMDPERPPVFDFLSFGADLSNAVYGLLPMKVALKKVQITNDDPLSLVGAAGGDAFLILLPKAPEHVEAVRSRLKGLSGPFFFMGKVKGPEAILEGVRTLAGLSVTGMAVASIMMGKMITAWNYPTKQLKPLEEVLGDAMPV